MAEHSTIARPYAEALFESVRDDARGLEYWSEVMSLLAQVSGMEDVREALGDPRLEDAQRIDLLTGLVPQALPEQAANLVALVVQNGRVEVLPQIAEQFELLRNRHEGTALARISSAFPMDEAQVASLVAGLEKKFGLKLKSVVTVDPDLIGGVRVAVGDHVLDTSVQARLASLRDSLAA
ncbi:MAG: F0F1 ATP synthase subunit delta [Castellaniella sp.]|uniref:F0F1 ATP synthase subunit delta n=1 Tax=Castellaniella sp. S9 TaxID=2993652 RepID=UPI0022B53711|nr:F0F1 ATP synthase subunit delta [Castellaniella sp. S9]